LLVNLPSPHPEAPTHPSTPKVLQTKDYASTLYSFVVFTLKFESIKELGSASHTNFQALEDYYTISPKANNFVNDVNF